MKNFFAHQVLEWYYQQGRELPWRQKGLQNPYYIWVSEIMLQQTSVAKVIPFFQKFIEAFPTITHVAEASEDDILFLWQGLGYYGRARNFHKAARLLVECSSKNGVIIFPKKEEEWRLLPGVGPYTAAALAAIISDHSTIPLDVNVVRVFQRYLHWPEFSPQAAQKFFLTPEGKKFFAKKSHGDYVQALMELGQVICVKKRVTQTRGKSPTLQQPLCDLCPVSSTCASRKIGRVPVDLKPLGPKPHRYGHTFLFREGTKIMVWKNTQHALLKGLFGFPVTSFFTGHCPDIPLHETITRLGTVHHSFTHFHVELFVWQGLWEVFPYKAYLTKGEFVWVPLEDLEHMAFSTLMRKVQAHL